jgi:hypothetical protein
MQLQGGTHLVIPSVLRFLLMPAEDSYRLETPWPVVETQRSRNAWESPPGSPGAIGLKNGPDCGVAMLLEQQDDGTRALFLPFSSRGQAQ